MPPPFCTMPRGRRNPKPATAPGVPPPPHWDPAPVPPPLTTALRLGAPEFKQGGTILVPCMLGGHIGHITAQYGTPELGRKPGFEDLQVAQTFVDGLVAICRGRDLAVNCSPSKKGETWQLRATEPLVNNLLTGLSSVCQLGIHWSPPQRWDRRAAVERWHAQDNA